MAQASGDIELEVPRDWLGYELGLRPPLLHPVDRVERYVDDASTGINSSDDGVLSNG